MSTKEMTTKGKGSRELTAGWNKEQIDLIKSTVAKGATDGELQLFLYTCQKTGLDPLIRQIHAVKRWDSGLGREAMAIQVGIDGYRLTAQRTQEMDGQEGPYWCGEDGAWNEVWLDQTKPPVAAKVIVFRKGHGHPYTGIARYEAYVQRKKGGEANSMWAKMPDGQLAKCAEALALRKAFPNELGGTHTEDELAHASTDAPPFKEPEEKVKESAAVETEIVPAAQPPAKPVAPVTIDRKVKVISAKGMKDTKTQKVTYEIGLDDGEGLYVAKTETADLARQAKAFEGKPVDVIASTVEDVEKSTLTLTAIRPA